MAERRARTAEEPRRRKKSSPKSNMEEYIPRAQPVYDEPTSYNPELSSSSSSSSYIDISRTFPSRGLRGLGAIRTFFTAPSEHRRVRRRRSKKFLRFANSSTSSVNSDLAYGTGFIKRRKGQSRPPRRRDDAETNDSRPGRLEGDAAILAMGAELAALARKQNRVDLMHARQSGNASFKRQSSEPEPNRETDTTRGTSMSKPAHRNRPADEEGWESASEDESDTSSIDSRLAYGSHVIKPTESGRPRPIRRKSSVVDPSLFGPQNSLHGIVLEPVGHGIVYADISQTAEPPTVAQDPSTLRRAESTVSSAPSRTQSMQYVYPMPTSDPTQFDVIRRASTMPANRPAPIPLQQPQPVAPVSQKVFEPDYATRSEPVISTKQSRSSSHTPSIAGAALAGIAASAVGAAIVADRREDRKMRDRDRKDNIDGDRRIRDDKQKDSVSDDRSKLVKLARKDSSREKRDPEDEEREARREARRQRRRDEERQEAEEDAARDARRERRRREEEAEEDAAREARRERRRREEDSTEHSRQEARKDQPTTAKQQHPRENDISYDDEKGSSSKGRQAVSGGFDGKSEPRHTVTKGPDRAGKTPDSDPVDPFQYQVADDAFPTPDGTRSAKEYTDKASDPPLKVVTVERVPHFAREDDYYQPITPTERHERAGRDADDSDERDKRRETYRTHDEAERIYRETEESTAPIDAAAISAAVAAVTAEDGRKARRASRDRSSRRKAYEPSSPEERDYVQEEADRAYREAVLARKIASERDEEQDGDPIVRIVTPPGMDDKKKKGPFDAPNADFQLDHVMDPHEFRGFTPTDARSYPSEHDFEQSKASEFPSKRPMLTLVRPTPTSTPTPESQTNKSESKKTRSQENEAEQSFEQPRSSQATPEVVIGPKGDVVLASATSTPSKGVRWGENETKHYDIESPGERRNEYFDDVAGSSGNVPKHEEESRDNVAETSKSASRHGDEPRDTKKRSGWGAIAAGIVGAGGAALAKSKDLAQISSKGNTGAEDDTTADPPTSRTVAVRPKASDVAKIISEPPPVGPKPSSPSSHMPGAFDDDLGFAATVAAGLQDSGFDPEIVIKNVEFRRRSSPPGGDQIIYRQPFAETVSDLGVLGIDSPGHEGAPPVQGFVLGEVPDTPREEKTIDPENFAIKRSMKEARRRDKNGITRVEDGEDDPTKIEDQGVPIVEEPESYVEPKSAKKAKKDKKSKRNSYLNYDDDDTQNSNRVSVPVDAFDDLRGGEEPAGTMIEEEWDAPKKSKKKSKKSSERYDSPPRPDPADVPLPSTSEMGGDDYEEPARSRKSSKRDSVISDRDTQSVGSRGASQYNSDNESRANSKKNRNKDKDRSKVKDQKEKTGGFFGLFGSSNGKSESDETKKTSYTKDPSKDDYDEPKRSGKKSKRDSAPDATSIYGGMGADSVTDVSTPSRSRSNGNNYDDLPQDDSPKKRSSSASSSNATSRSKNGDAREKQSFLAEAGTLGAGVGIALAAAAMVAQHQQSKAEHAESTTADIDMQPSTDVEAQDVQSPPAQPEVSTQDETRTTSPKISERQFRPSIDPRYGDLLPLPPSDAVQNLKEDVNELPPLPDSRPGSPRDEPLYQSSPATTKTRKATQQTPVKTPSDSAVPLSRIFIKGHGATPSSPVIGRASPSPAPSLRSPTSTSFPRSRPRPTSWEASKEFQPLFLLDQNRRGSNARSIDFDRYTLLPSSDEDASRSVDLDVMSPKQEPAETEQQSLRSSEIVSTDLDRPQTPPSKGGVDTSMSELNAPVSAEPEIPGDDIEAASKSTLDTSHKGTRNTRVVPMEVTLEDKSPSPPPDVTSVVEKNRPGSTATGSKSDLSIQKPEDEEHVADHANRALKAPSDKASQQDQRSSSEATAANDHAKLALVLSNDELHDPFRASVDRSTDPVDDVEMFEPKITKVSSKDKKGKKGKKSVSQASKMQAAVSNTSGSRQGVTEDLDESSHTNVGITSPNDLDEKLLEETGNAPSTFERDQAELERSPHEDREDNSRSVPHVPRSTSNQIPEILRQRSLGSSSTKHEPEGSPDGIKTGPSDEADCLDQLNTTASDEPRPESSNAFLEQTSVQAEDLPSVPESRPLSGWPSKPTEAIDTFGLETALLTALPESRPGSPVSSPSDQRSAVVEDTDRVEFEAATNTALPPSRPESPTPALTHTGVLIAGETDTADLHDAQHTALPESQSQSRPMSPATEDVKGDEIPEAADVLAAALTALPASRPQSPARSPDFAETNVAEGSDTAGSQTAIRTALPASPSRSPTRYLNDTRSAVAKDAQLANPQPVTNVVLPRSRSQSPTQIDNASNSSTIEDPGSADLTIAAHTILPESRSQSPAIPLTSRKSSIDRDVEMTGIQIASQTMLSVSRDHSPTSSVKVIKRNDSEDVDLASFQSAKDTALPESPPESPRPMEPHSFPKDLSSGDKSLDSNDLREPSVEAEIEPFIQSSSKKDKKKAKKGRLLPRSDTFEAAVSEPLPNTPGPSALQEVDTMISGEPLTQPETRAVPYPAAEDEYFPAQASKKDKKKGKKAKILLRSDTFEAAVSEPLPDTPGPTAQQGVDTVIGDEPSTQSETRATPYAAAEDEYFPAQVSKKDKKKGKKSKLLLRSDTFETAVLEPLPDSPGRMAPQEPETVMDDRATMQNETPALPVVVADDEYFPAQASKRDKGKGKKSKLLMRSDTFETAVSEPLPDSPGRGVHRDVEKSNDDDDTPLPLANLTAMSAASEDHYFSPKASKKDKKKAKKDKSSSRFATFDDGDPEAQPDSVVSPTPHKEVDQMAAHAGKQELEIPKAPSAPAEEDSFTEGSSKRDKKKGKKGNPPAGSDAYGGTEAHLRTDNPGPRFPTERLTEDEFVPQPIVNDDATMPVEEEALPQSSKDIGTGKKSKVRPMPGTFESNSFLEPFEMTRDEIESTSDTPTSTKPSEALQDDVVSHDSRPVQISRELSSSRQKPLESRSNDAELEEDVASPYVPRGLKKDKGKKENSEDDHPSSDKSKAATTTLTDNVEGHKSDTTTTPATGNLPALGKSDAQQDAEYDTSRGAHETLPDNEVPVQSGLTSIHTASDPKEDHILAEVSKQTSDEPMSPSESFQTNAKISNEKENDVESAFNLDVVPTSNTGHLAVTPDEESGAERNFMSGDSENTKVLDDGGNDTANQTLGRQTSGIALPAVAAALLSELAASEADAEWAEPIKSDKSKKLNRRALQPDTVPVSQPDRTQSTSSEKEDVAPTAATIVEPVWAEPKSSKKSKRKGKKTTLAWEDETSIPAEGSKQERGQSETGGAPTMTTSQNVSDVLSQKDEHLLDSSTNHESAARDTAPSTVEASSRSEPVNVYSADIDDCPESTAPETPSAEKTSPARPKISLAIPGAFEPFESAPLEYADPEYFPSAVSLHTPRPSTPSRELTPQTEIASTSALTSSSATPTHSHSAAAMGKTASFGASHPMAQEENDPVESESRSTPTHNSIQQNNPLDTSDKPKSGSIPLPSGSNDLSSFADIERHGTPIAASIPLPSSPITDLPSEDKLFNPATGYDPAQLLLAKQLQAEFQPGSKRTRKGKKDRSVPMTPDATEYIAISSGMPKDLETQEPVRDSPTTEGQPEESLQNPSGQQDAFTEEQLQLARQMREEFSSGKKRSKKDKKDRSGSRLPHKDESNTSYFDRVGQAPSQGTPATGDEDSPFRTPAEELNSLPTGYNEEQLELARQMQEDFTSGSKRSKNDRKRSGVQTPRNKDRQDSAWEEPSPRESSLVTSNQEESDNFADALPVLKKSKKDKKSRGLKRTVSDTSAAARDAGSANPDKTVESTEANGAPDVDNQAAKLTSSISRNDKTEKKVRNAATGLVQTEASEDNDNEASSLATMNHSPIDEDGTNGEGSEAKTKGKQDFDLQNQSAAEASPLIVQSPRESRQSPIKHAKRDEEHRTARSESGLEGHTGAAVLERAIATALPESSDIEVPNERDEGSGFKELMAGTFPIDPVSQEALSRRKTDTGQGGSAISASTTPPALKPVGYSEDVGVHPKLQVEVSDDAETGIFSRRDPLSVKHNLVGDSSIIEQPTTDASGRTVPSTMEEKMTGMTDEVPVPDGLEEFVVKKSKKDRKSNKRSNLSRAGESLDGGAGRNFVSQEPPVTQHTDASDRPIDKVRPVSVVDLRQHAGETGPDPTNSDDTREALAPLESIRGAFDRAVPNEPTKDAYTKKLSKKDKKKNKPVFLDIESYSTEDSPVTDHSHLSQDEPEHSQTSKASSHLPESDNDHALMTINAADLEEPRHLEEVETPPPTTTATSIDDLGRQAPSPQRGSQEFVQTNRDIEARQDGPVAATVVIDESTPDTEHEDDSSGYNIGKPSVITLQTFLNSTTKEPTTDSPVVDKPEDEFEPAGKKGKKSKRERQYASSVPKTEPDSRPASEEQHLTSREGSAPIDSSKSIAAQNIAEEESRAPEQILHSQSSKKDKKKAKKTLRGMKTDEPESTTIPATNLDSAHQSTPPSPPDPTANEAARAPSSLTTAISRPQQVRARSLPRVDTETSNSEINNDFDENEVTTMTPVRTKDGSSTSEHRNASALDSVADKPRSIQHGQTVAEDGETAAKQELKAQPNRADEGQSTVLGKVGAFATAALGTIGLAAGTIVSNTRTNQSTKDEKEPEKDRESRGIQDVANEAMSAPARKSKKEKRQKIVDKRSSQRDDMFDDPAVWEGAEPRAFTEASDEHTTASIEPHNPSRSPTMDHATSRSRSPTVHNTAPAYTAEDANLMSTEIVPGSAALEREQLDDSGQPSHMPERSQIRSNSENDNKKTRKPNGSTPTFQDYGHMSKSQVDDHEPIENVVEERKKDRSTISSPLLNAPESGPYTTKDSHEGEDPADVSPSRHTSTPSAAEQGGLESLHEDLLPRILPRQQSNQSQLSALGHIDDVQDRARSGEHDQMSSPFIESYKEHEARTPSKPASTTDMTGNHRLPDRQWSTPTILPVLVEEESPRSQECEHNTLKRQPSTRDLNRDSGVVTESPVPSTRAIFHKPDEQEHVRDSGVHLRDISPSPSERETYLSRSDDAIARLSWPAVDDDAETVDLKRSHRSRDSQPTSRHPANSAVPLSTGLSAVPGLTAAALRQHERLSPTHENASRDRLRSETHRLQTPEHHVRPGSVNSIRSSASGTPPLRRSDRKISGDLRSLSQRSQLNLAKEAKEAERSPATSTVNDSDPVANEGRVRTKDMADVYDGYGEGRIGSPRSPTRPHSMRRRQSMQVLDLEARLEQLAAENRTLAEGKAQVEQTLHDSRRVAITLADRDAELESLKSTLDWLHREVDRLKEVNDGLSSANVALGAQHNERYGHLESEHAQATKDLRMSRAAHGSLEADMENMVRNEVARETTAKDEEIAHLRQELESAQSQIRIMQQQILEAKANEGEFLTVRDEDYFDNACQQLCGHVQQWVLRFSKFSDMRACRLTSEINNDKIIDRLDNAVLDGSDVDVYLSDRVKRRDIFMSMTMSMIWEFVFTRYLFGMDREQRQKLKSLEKTLSEVGLPAAVHQWRAVTLTLLSKRTQFVEQREQDTEAVVQMVFSTLSEILPPPSHLEEQIQEQLRRVLRSAVELSIEMRTQRAEYMMLPPLQPEYDANGDLADTVSFNAGLMNERSGDTVSNEELEQQKAVVRVVLFPLVVKKGDDNGGGDEEIVVCPAQVLVAKPKRNVRMFSPSSVAGTSRISMQSSMPEGHADMI